jgi:esterase/lipase superfamily enzyme
MTAIRLFYATNRAHTGRDRAAPSGYGPKFSNDGIENLRFGKVTFDADAKQIGKFVNKRIDGGVGDGKALGEYFLKQVRKSMSITPYPEVLDPLVSDTQQPDAKLGSKAMFVDLHDLMCKATDIVVFIHGFNVTWPEAVASAGALQQMLSDNPARDPSRNVQVMLFSWPSDGMALPYVSYKSDRTEAQGSGYAFARGLLKLRDFLAAMRDEDGKRLALCRRSIHLLCHSMGNYVLQSTVKRMADFTPGSTMPRLFEHVFMCAPDVDDNVFELNEPLSMIHELAHSVTVYHNRGDKAMYVSDYTKGNAERLGTNGCARPAAVHNKIHQVDCSDVVNETFDEHSYYLWGLTNADIRQSIDGLTHDAPARRRLAPRELPNVWALSRSGREV